MAAHYLSLTGFEDVDRMRGDVELFEPSNGRSTKKERTSQSGTSLM
jgi:hypothetical protein